MFDSIIQALASDPELLAECLIVLGFCLAGFTLLLTLCINGNERKIDRLRKELLALRQRGGYSR